MNVSDLMTKEVVTIKPDLKVKDAAKIMVEGRFSVLPVVNDDNELLGVITESDFVGKQINVPHALASIKQLFGQSFYFKDVEEIHSEAKEKSIKDVMTTDVKTTNPDVSLNDLTSFMLANRIKRVPVVENGKLVGIITRQDLIKSFVATK